MKRVDMANVRVVCAGEDWRHPLPPCSREMMRYLERNERLVTWLQPVGGNVQDQVPAIRVKDCFYTISLRMMKAIWRHVRLKKGFENIERAPYGGLKLKIPVALLAEKLRTQSRFNVMRMSTAVKERKVSQSAPSKIDSIIKQLFLPMLVMPTPSHTSFQAEDCEELLLRQVAQDRPGALGSEQAFVEYMVGLYRRFQAAKEELLEVGIRGFTVPEEDGMQVGDAVGNEIGNDAVMDMGQGIKMDVRTEMEIEGSGKSSCPLGQPGGHLEAVPL